VEEVVLTLDQEVFLDLLELTIEQVEVEVDPLMVASVVLVVMV
tara:strand:- start:123 stop:251 length:129 start_codon:yes stop_codon:yes gene_type:complete